MKLTKITPTGATSSVTVSDSVFAAPVNKTLLSQAVRVYLSNKRQGTSYTKTRGEVNRTKKKWYKQKGTGNARHGARSANIFVGGGTAHGPKGNTNWTLKLTSVMKKKALISALSAQVAQMVVSAEIMKLSGKTKDAVTLMNQVAPAAEKILLVINSSEEMVLRGLRNIESVLVVSAGRVNALEILMADKIILTPEAVQALEERLATVQVEAEVVQPEVESVAAPKKAVPAKKAVAKKTVTKKVATKKVASKKETK